MHILGIEDLSGYAALKPKQRVFVQALFEGCSNREAARRAGVHGSTDQSLDVQAHKHLRSAKVQALMSQAWARSGADVSATLRQAAELAAQAFAEVKEAVSREQKMAAFKRWREASALIASIHGKLQLKVTGDMTHRVVLTDEDRAHLIELQQAVATRAGGRN